VAFFLCRRRHAKRQSDAAELPQFSKQQPPSFTPAPLFMPPAVRT
jgi:hypothetical protein